MPQFWYIFSRRDSGVERHPEIADLQPRLWPGNRADWVGGRWGAISPDNPEIAERHPPINWAQFLKPNRDIGFLHFGTFQSARQRPGNGSINCGYLAAFRYRVEGRRDRR